VLATAAVRSFANAAKNTLVLSVAGGALGFGLGLALALFTMSKRRVVRAPARIYINFFRGTPLIWQISFAGIGVVPALRLDLSMYTIAILVLGLNLAAYSAEVYRAGIQSLDRGQMEAPRSLGLTYFQSMRFVIVPQAIRRVIPPLLNEFVILIKDTSLVSVLGLTFAQKELLGFGRDIYSSTFDATAFLGSAAGYLIITIPMIRVVTIVERRLRSGLTSVIG
jgi:His/Glu/Gln/Arg/opine family amino acid ABC transporter permease subunit